MPSFRRYAASNVTSPNQEGVDGTDSAAVWMITDPSEILVISASLRVWDGFSLSKRHIFILARYSLGNSWNPPKPHQLYRRYNYVMPTESTPSRSLSTVLWFLEALFQKVSHRA